MPIFSVSPAVLLLYLPFHYGPIPELEHDVVVGMDGHGFDHCIPKALVKLCDQFLLPFQLFQKSFYPLPLDLPL